MSEPKELTYIMDEPPTGSREAVLEQEIRRLGHELVMGKHRIMILSGERDCLRSRIQGFEKMMMTMAAKVDEITGELDKALLEKKAA